MNDEPKRGSGWTQGAMWAAAVLVIYVLSIGPVNAWATTWYQSWRPETLGKWDLLRQVYAPMRWIGQSEPIHSWIKDYEETWEGWWPGPLPRDPFGARLF